MRHMDGLARRLAEREGTVEFKVAADDLVAASADAPLVNAEAPTRDAVIQLYCTDSEVVYEHVIIDLGRATCSIPLTDLDDSDRFHVFLTWSLTEASLYIGPYPPRGDGDLRKDTALIAD